MIDGRQTDRSDPLLNEPQRRRFEVFLEMLEESLDEVERVASLPHHKAASRIEYEVDIPPGFVDQSEPIIRRLRTEIEALAQVLDIPPRPRSRLNTIRAIVTAETVRVEDTFSDKLRGYGSVNSRVKNEIDPLLSEIRSDLKALLANLNPNER